MAQHSHRFTIADNDAVRVLLAKLVRRAVGNRVGGINCFARLTMRLGTTKDSNQKVRQAFFHGLLTGYAVALTLR